MEPTGPFRTGALLQSGRVIHTSDSTRRGVVSKRNHQGKAADDSLSNSRMSVAGHAIAHLNS
jgi:hypothetical protein